MNWAFYKRLLSYLLPYKARLAVQFCLTIIFSILDAASLGLLVVFVKLLFNTGKIPNPDLVIDWLNRLKDQASLYITTTPDKVGATVDFTLFLLAVMVVKNLIDWLRSVLIADVQEAVTRDLRNQSYGHLVAMDMGFFTRSRVGEVVNRLTGDIETMRMAMTRELAILITNIIMVFVCLGAMLWASWSLTLVALLVIPLTLGVWGRFVRRLRGRDRRALDIRSALTGQIQETVAGIRAVKAGSAEAFEMKRFMESSGRYYRIFFRSEALRAVATPLTEIISAIGICLVVVYGARQEQTGQISADALVYFLVLAAKLYQPVKYLSKFPAIIQPGLVAAERVFEFLDLRPVMVDAPDALDFPGLQQGIEFKDVAFSYSADDVHAVEGLTFSLPAGQVVALVGASGAGKSTIADLTARFYDPSSGKVLADGRDLVDFKQTSYRSHLGIVAQETVIFHDTVRANISYGIVASDEEIARAAQFAYADEFIDELPEKYDTILGERGTRLSGGQRQRIAIARALLRNPPILILDEATSALDTRSERFIQSAIEKLLVGRTVLVIAHRLSTIRRADRILVVDRGRIVESGNHDELLKLGGAYARLHALQFQDAPSQS